MNAWLGCFNSVDDLTTHATRPAGNIFSSLSWLLYGTAVCLRPVKSGGAHLVKGISGLKENEQ
jgi:hypothetical protein